MNKLKNKLAYLLCDAIDYPLYYIFRVLIGIVMLKIAISIITY